MLSVIPLLAALAGRSASRDVPTNIQNLYDTIKAEGSCKKTLATGFYSSDQGPGTFSYCGDHLDSANVIYISGQNGALTNMDIDCDGAQGGPSDNSRCNNTSSPDIQDVTTFQSVVAGYRRGIIDLNTYVHPYVVFGNSGNKTGWKTFDPTTYNVQPLSVVAVVCGNQLIYGIWGDTNGDDGTYPMVGEASYAMGVACYPNGDIRGDNGHEPDDVLYLVFPGSDAVPGPDGVNWSAVDYGTFEQSLMPLGDQVINRMPEIPAPSDASAPGKEGMAGSWRIPMGTGYMAVNMVMFTWAMVSLWLVAL